MKSFLFAILAYFGMQRASQAASVNLPKSANVALSQNEILFMVRSLNLSRFGGWFKDYDVMAIIEIESSFNQRAINPKDPSYGLMQIMPASAADRGFTGSAQDLLDAETNLLYGMRHLKWTYEYIDARKAAAVTYPEWIGAYNAGVGNWAKGFFSQAYVSRFSAAQNKWKGLIG